MSARSNFDMSFEGPDADKAVEALKQKENFVPEDIQQGPGRVTAYQYDVRPFELVDDLIAVSQEYPGVRIFAHETAAEDWDGEEAHFIVNGSIDSYSSALNYPAPTLVFEALEQGKRIATQGSLAGTTLTSLAARIESATTLEEVKALLPVVRSSAAAMANLPMPFGEPLNGPAEELVRTASQQICRNYVVTAPAEVRGLERLVDYAEVLSAVRERARVMSGQELASTPVEQLLGIFQDSVQGVFNTSAVSSDVEAKAIIGRLRDPRNPELRVNGTPVAEKPEAAREL